MKIPNPGKLLLEEPMLLILKYGIFLPMVKSSPIRGIREHVSFLRLYYKVATFGENVSFTTAVLQVATFEPELREYGSRKRTGPPPNAKTVFSSGNWAGLAFGGRDFFEENKVSEWVPAQPEK